MDFIPGGNVFELDKVCFNYPYEAQVLKNITFKVCGGESICVLGANGSGKSTLLKLLSGLIFPVAGVFRAYGKEVTEKAMNNEEYSRAFHKKIGFIFQNSDVQLFCSTVREEVAFGPLQLKLSVSEARERVNDILHLLGIEHLQDKTPFKLSGGEKKKVALASALVLNPEVLILDEPANGLDPRTQRWLAGLLASLNKAGKTIITSTHSLELVREISDRCLVFGEDHLLAADGATVDILQDAALLRRVNLVDEYYHMRGGRYY